MISKQLVNYVHKEAAKLKANATPEELGKLDFETLRPEQKHRCIYGQMTYDCFNRRAIELLMQCAQIGINDTLRDTSCSLVKVKKTMLKQRQAFSPIEVYIAQSGADNKQLIDYLKGELDSLDLTPTVNC